MISCDFCKGNGKILRFPHRCRFWRRGHDFEWLLCPLCEGTGVADPEPLPDLDPSKWFHYVPESVKENNDAHGS